MTEQLSLFPEEAPERPKQKGNTCRGCKSIYRHEYGKMLYCNKRYDPRTTYGNKKIRAGDSACLMFEPRRITKKSIEKK